MSLPSDRRLIGVAPSFFLLAFIGLHVLFRLKRELADRAEARYGHCKNENGIKILLRMTRRLLRCKITAFFTVLALLFSQLAMASYVCPTASNAAAMSKAMARGEPCAGLDSAQPVLCYQYAANLSQSFEQVKASAPSLPAIFQELLVPPVRAAESHAPPLHAEPERQHPPPHPVFLATGRLRV